MHDIEYPRSVVERAAKIPGSFFAEHAEVIQRREALDAAKAAHAAKIPAY